MEYTSLVAALVGLFFAGMLKGATGLGYSSCALPFLAAAVGLKTAIVLVILPAMVSNIAVVVTTGFFRETVLRFWPLFLATLPGIWLGVQGLLWLDQRLTEICLGILIIAYSVLSLARPNLALPAYLERPLQVPAGLLNGMLTGLTGSQVLPLVPYVMALRLDPDRTVQAINLSVTLASLFMGLALINAGLMSVPTATLSLIAIAPALAGIMLGTRARRMIPAQNFRVVVLATLAVLGALLIARA